MTRSEAGFALIEVIVAFAILSLALMALYGTMGASYRAANASRIQEEARDVGLSQLDRIGADLPVVEGRLTGELSDGSPWQIVLVPNVRQPEGAASRFVRYDVIYEAKDLQGRSLLRLQTMRLAKASRG